MLESQQNDLDINSDQFVDKIEAKFLNNEVKKLPFDGFIDQDYLQTLEITREEPTFMSVAVKQSIFRERHDERISLKEDTDVLKQEHWRLKELDGLDTIDMKVDP